MCQSCSLKYYNFFYNYYGWDYCISSAYAFILKRQRVQGFIADLFFFARMCSKQGINLAAGGCKISSIPVNLGNLEICIATKRQIAKLIMKDSAG